MVDLPTRVHPEIPSPEPHVPGPELPIPKRVKVCAISGYFTKLSQLQVVLWLIVRPAQVISAVPSAQQDTISQLQVVAQVSNIDMHNFLIW